MSKMKKASRSSVTVNLRKTLQPEFMFHITADNLGPVCKLQPRSSKDEVYRLEHEPDIPRICVAPDPRFCLAAINYCTTSPYHVYVTVQKVESFHPYGVADSWITNERWLLQETDFKKIDIIKPKLMSLLPANEECGSNHSADLSKQLGVLRTIQKVITKDYLKLLDFKASK